ncbi:hypothetical protein [Leptospira alexanderi]|uniref:hypothetical protein n=1 Tax=Leptospira alexanderi TaxID=100053 RepID=UPI00138AE0D7|nr:hypothetical protein [Leptospira alexanderi]
MSLNHGIKLWKRLELNVSNTEEESMVAKKKAAKKAAKKKVAKKKAAKKKVARKK